MRMRQVEAFRAVMVSGGVTAAAAIMNLSQPSVSRLISDLEASVGFQLFERRGGRVIPTAQAEALFDSVKRSFIGLDLLDQAARRIRAHPVGTIRVAALSAIAAGVLPPVIADFNARYPNIKITVEALGQSGVVDRVFLGQADIGLIVEAPSRPGIVSTALVEAEYVCILPAGHHLGERDHVDVGDLDGETFIGPMHEVDALWFGLDQLFEGRGIELLRRLETQHSFPTYAYVEAGLGISIAEPFSAPLFQRLGVLVRRFLPTMKVPFALIEPEIGPSPPVISEFRIAVREAAVRRVESALTLADTQRDHCRAL